MTTDLKNPPPQAAETADRNPQTVVGRTKRERQLGLTLERFAIPMFLVLLIVFFCVDPATSSSFTRSSNIENILANQSVTGLIALAMIAPLLAGYFDLSTAAVAGLGNVVTAALVVSHGVPLPIAIVAGILAGTLAGAINGFLVAGVKLNPFVTTLGTYILLGGLLTLYTKGATITNGFPESAVLWMSGKFLGVARPLWILVAIALVLWYVLTQTPFGRRLAAIGSNESAARLAGIRVDRAVFISYLMAGTIAGMAGALLTIQNNGGDSTTAISYLFAALAAVFLGQTAINPGRYNVWGTIIGVFFVAVAVDGFILLGAAASVTSVFNGGALVFSVTVSTLLGRFRARRAQAVRLDALRAAEPAGDLPQEPRPQTPAVAGTAGGSAIDRV